MGVLFQVLKIIFKVQREMSNGKITRKEIGFPTYKTWFFSFFFSFGPLLLSNLIPFLFPFHFKWFKVLKERHLKFYKLYLNFDNNKTTYKEFCGCLGTSLCNIWWFVFLFFTPLFWGAINFSNLSHFWWFLVH